MHEFTGGYKVKFYRTMSGKDKVFHGTAYVARIRDPSSSSNIHNRLDFLHAVAFCDPRESLDYMDLRRIIENDNKLALYAYTINKADRTSFTWGMCLDAIASQPPRGDACVTFHERPVPFSEFAEMAYGRAILSDSDGYSFLTSKTKKQVTSLPNTSALDLEMLPPPSGPACRMKVNGNDLLSLAVNSGIGESLSMDLSSSEVQLIGGQHHLSWMKVLGQLW